jgi:serine/threonine protein kinase
MICRVRHGRPAIEMLRSTGRHPQVGHATGDDTGNAQPLGRESLLLGWLGTSEETVTNRNQLCKVGTRALVTRLRYDGLVGTSETLRSVLEAGSTSKRLDELSTARVIGQTALKVHAAQQKAGPGKAVGPITPGAVAIATNGDITLTPPDRQGALAYSAPETISGSSDRRSDVFSLGVMMWEALTHQRLFEAMNDAAVKAAVTERDITPPGEINANIPAELSAICMKALARNPADRYQSTKVMAVEIEEMLSEAGYEDNNEQVAAYMAELPKQREGAKAKLPAPHVAKPITSSPPMAIPKVSSPTSPPPSVLATPPSPSPAMTMLGTAPGPMPAAPAPVAVGSAPMAPVLPATKSPSGSTPPIAAASADAAQPSTEAVAMTLTPPPGMTVAPSSAPAPREAPPYVPKSNGTNGAGASDTMPAAKPDPAAPHPAAIVALPSARRDPTDTGGRKSQELLGNWGWQTDSVAAIDDEDDYAPGQTSRKTLIYLIGGGLVLALVVTVIAVGFGGSKKKPEPAAAAKPANADMMATPEAPKPAAVVASAGSDVGSSADVGAGSNAEPVGSAAVATGPSPEQIAGSATEPKPEPVAVAPEPKVEPKPEPKPEPKIEPAPEPKIDPKTTKPDKIAKVEPKPDPKIDPKAAKTTKPDKIAKVEPKLDPKTTKVTKTTKPDKIAKIEPKATKTTKPDKADVETSYRNGIQQFARGDTNGALTSLRTSLAGNPNYPPTWRGLGLVFEKMGEKDQARAAFRRYLQLSPNAGDAEQIRSRLERLGS